MLIISSKKRSFSIKITNFILYTLNFKLFFIPLHDKMSCIMNSQDILSIKQRFGIIGTNPMLHRAIDIAVQVAKTDLSVLITGESGVGKEHFPKIIHAYSARKHGAYFAVNCGAIPEGTIDSELFGHDKGAFTDAKGDHKGYFEIADGGTLFLDEVGELPMKTQVRLLRVLETGEFIRVGSSVVRKTDVRVVAATNLNMLKAIDEGRFREDLYFRLNTIDIKVPALRERREDIPILFRKFSVDFCERYKMPPLSLNEEATQLLQSAYWRGNIRQLKNLAYQISLIELDHQINAETLRKYLPRDEQQQGLVLRQQPKQQEKDYSHEIGILYNMVLKLQQELEQLKKYAYSSNSSPHAILPSQTDAAEWAQSEIVEERVVESSGNVDERNDSSPNVEDYIQGSEGEWSAEDISSHVISMGAMEKEHIHKALQACNGNRKKAAEMLHISERTLYRKIKEYDL